MRRMCLERLSCIYFVDAELVKHRNIPILQTHPVKTLPHSPKAAEIATLTFSIPAQVSNLTTVVVNQLLDISGNPSHFCSC